MKTLLKFVLSFVVGIILITAGISMGGLEEFNKIFPDFHIDLNLEGKVENQTMTYSTSVHSLDFNIHNASIQFKEYDGDDIKVEAKNIFKSFTINENDWKIVIHQPQTLGISHNNTADITIYVPYQYQFQSIDVDAGVGYVKMNDVKAHTLDIDQGAGRFELNNCYVNNLIVDTGLSVSSLSHLNCVNTMDIDVGMSVVNIDMINNLNNYDRNVDVGFGSVKINDEEYAGFSSNHHQNNYNNKCIKVNCGFSAVDIKGGY